MSNLEPVIRRFETDGEKKVFKIHWKKKKSVRH
jgi:hypothetical protein